MLEVDQVVVIGTGLLGTSIALGLKRAGYVGEIVGLGRRMRTLEAARARGGFDRLATDDDQAIRDGALVVVAVPLGGFTQVFDQLARVPAERCIVTDVGSTKTMVMQAARQRLRREQRFVGSHPMAGSEERGPRSGRADLFEGKPCVITTDADGPGEGLVEAMWKMLGMTILRMSAEEHDRAAAVVSHLPHLASVLLVETAAKLGGWEVASTGFRDTTRLASSNPPMRADIIAANRGPILEALGVLRGQIDELSRLIAAGSEEGGEARPEDDPLLYLLKEASRRRERWVSDASFGPQQESDHEH